MPFTTSLACSVGDDGFGDRQAFSYHGDLDEFTEEGILVRRADDSIIFSSAEPLPLFTDSGSAPSGMDEKTVHLQDDLKKTEEAISSETTKQTPEPEQEQAFIPHPGLHAFLTHLGASEEEASLFEQQARQSLETLSFNRALFSVRDMEKLFSKNGMASWMAKPEWPEARLELLNALNLEKLTPDLSIGPNSMYALADFIAMEEDMIELAKKENNAHPIPLELVDSVLASKPTMAEEQKVAAIASCSGNKAVVVTEGTAGAGKSFTLNAIREIYEKAPPSKPGEDEGYDIIGTALSWTATKVLEESAGLSGGRAIQGLTMAMEEAHANGGDFFKRRTILIVDEAGLVGVKHMHKILWHAANSSQAVRVLLTGDSLQLCPVEAGNALEAIVEECGSSRLDTIRRQKQASHRAAVKHFCYGRAEQGLWTFWQQEAVHFSANAVERRELVMRDYVRYCISNPQDIALVLALENAEVKKLNDEIRARLKLVGRLLGDEHEMTVTDGRGSYKANFCVGDQIVLRKNKVDHPVFKSEFEKIFNGAAAAQRLGETQSSMGSFAKMIAEWKNKKIKPLPAASLKASLTTSAKNSAQTPISPASSEPLVGKKIAGEPEEIRQGIFNRTTGIIIDIRKNPEDPSALLIRILLGEGGEIEIDTSKYFDDKAGAVPLHHNFATTIYASQGQTVQKVLIMDSPYMNRRLAYVGMSRHTMMCDIYADCEEIDARVSKEGERQMERAWKRFEKDTHQERGPEQMRIAKLKTVISEWQPKLGKKAGDYLQAMANAWNVDSANPTVLIAKKQMTRKLKILASGGKVGYPILCAEDNPDDHLSPRMEEPYLFEDLQMAAPAKKPQNFLAGLSAKKRGEPELSTEVLSPVVLADHRESSTMPSWTHSELAAEALATTQDKHWGINRFGYPRFFSIHPQHGRPVSRWGFDGGLKAGDGAPAVMPNPTKGKHAPWMVVSGPREALLSYAHYRKTLGREPEKIPNIVAAPPACDLSLLSSWLRPGEATLHCAWSAKLPETLDWARDMAARLRKLGHSATVYPPEPAPVDATRKTQNLRMR
jgi:hypothetical protein